jgi:hypothetical protein
MFERVMLVKYGGWGYTRMEMFQTSATEELNGQLGNVAALSPQRGPLASFEQGRSRERQEN